MPRANPYEYQRVHDKKVAESVCVGAVVKVLTFDKKKMTVNVQPCPSAWRMAAMRASPRYSVYRWLSLAAVDLSSGHGTSPGTWELSFILTTTWMLPSPAGRRLRRSLSATMLRPTLFLLGRLWLASTKFQHRFLTRASPSQRMMARFTLP